MAHFECHQCGHTQFVDDKYLGKMAGCPKCKTRSEVLSSTFTMPPSPRSMAPACSSQSTRGGLLGISSPNWLRTELLINKRSSIRREHRSITDDSLPARFVKTPVVSAVNYSNDDNLHLVYEAHPTIECTHTPVRAIEIRYVIFDIWGDRLQALTATEIQDVAPTSTITCEHKWGPFLQSDIDEYAASLAFIARVRTANDAVIECEWEYVVEQARKYSSSFSPTDLKQKGRHT